MIRTKEDVETSYHRGSVGHPMQNVKVHKTLKQGYNAWNIDNPDHDPRFTVEWINEHISDDRSNSIFNACCEMRWEDLQAEAEDTWDQHVKVYAEGRQGGWAVVHGLYDVESWDAIDLAKWRRFAGFARRTADHIMYDFVDFVYSNFFGDWRDEQSELAAPAMPEYLRTS